MRRSTEEIFALFVSVAFVVDAGKGIYKGENCEPLHQQTSFPTILCYLFSEFKKTYKSEACEMADYLYKYGTDKGEGPYPENENASSYYTTDYPMADPYNSTDAYSGKHLSTCIKVTS